MQFKHNDGRYMNSKQALLSTQVELDIPFHDCDPMQVVWHGNYARYFEVARCELLRLFDYDYDQMQLSGYMWPIVDMRTKYIAPLRFRQKVTVTAYLKEYQHRLKLDYIITDSESGQILTKGYTIQVAVAIADQQMQYVSPEALLTQLKKVISVE